MKFNAGAATIFPSGLTRVIPPPSWPIDDTEMGCCQEGFFLKYSQNISGIRLGDLLHFYDCIGFMGPEDAGRWLPVWLCGAIYAVEVLEDGTECVVQWAVSALFRCLKAGTVDLPAEAVKYVVENICDPIDRTADNMAEVEKYLQQ